jgi:serine/threonine protein kinase
LHPGKIVGTADYLPPEQIMSPGLITPAGDIYSLGCTLYYAVTGKVPYPGGTTRQKAHRHCNDTAWHPRIVNPALSDAFIEVMAAMMERDPTKRIQTADEVVRRLAPWAGKAVPAPEEQDETAGVPPRANSPLPVAEEVEDAAGNFVDPILLTETDAPSQASQRTDPVASADQETLPEAASHRLARLSNRLRGGLSAKAHEISLLVLALAILTPIAIVGAIWLLILLIRGIGG